MHIDSLAEITPDSAITLFSHLSPGQDHFTQEEKAFYGLLQTKFALASKKKIDSDSTINAVINYYENTKNFPKLAFAYFYKSQISLSSSLDSLAIIYALKAIDKAITTHNLQLSTESYLHLGFIHLLQNLPENALREFKKAYHLTDSIPHPSYYKPLILMHMARAYNLKKILSKPEEETYTDTAINYYHRALDLITDSTCHLLSPAIYQELATIYQLNQDFPKAFKCLESSKDTANIKQYYFKKANIFMSMNELDSAYVYTQKSLSGKGLYQKYTTYDMLYRIERARQNDHEAIKYSDTLLIQADSLIARTIPNKIIDILKKYNEEKLRTKKMNLEIKYEKKKSYSLRISSIIVVLLFLSTYIYIYGYLKKKRLQQSLLKQKNELMLLNQKIQQWDLQVKQNQAKLQQLVQEKKQIADDLHLVSKEKEAILREKDEKLAYYRTQEHEIYMQKSKYEELYSVEFKKLFSSFPISRKISAFGADKIVSEALDDHLQQELMNIMDEVCCNFASRLYTLLQKSTEKTCLCCLIQLQVKPQYIMVLCGLSKEAYYKKCQRIAKELTGKSSASALKEYLSSF